VPAGGVSPDDHRWVHPRYAGFFLPVKVLSRVFRGKFVEGLHRACRGELDLSGATAALRDPVHWHAFVNALFRTDWVVYAKPAFGGPAAVLRYLGRYTHRVAISNHRLMAFDGERVTFRWKDYTHEGQRRTMTNRSVRFFVSSSLRGYVCATTRYRRKVLSSSGERVGSPVVDRRKDRVGGQLDEEYIAQQWQELDAGDFARAAT
jgi:Putative transposase